MNLALGYDILANGGRRLSIGEVEAGDGERELRFPISGVANFLRPVVEVIPAQVLAYRLAAQQGYLPGAVRYISKVITTEEGIPRWTKPLSQR